MTAKVFLAIGIGVGIALLLQARYETRNEARTIKNETRQWADRTAQLFVGAVEHSMLRGDGIAVKESIADLEQRVTGVDVRIYDHRGIEVFAAKPPAPAPGTLPPDLAAVLAEGRRTVSSSARVFRPLTNEERCHECHDDKSRLRGVIEIGFVDRAASERREYALAQIITAGFTQIMSARQSELLDDYFAEVSRAAISIDRVAVFDNGVARVFGSDLLADERPLLDDSLQVGAEPRYLRRTHGILALVPLPMQQRCVACHDDDIGEIRGVLAISLAGNDVSLDAVKDELESVIETTLRYIMLSQLGRRIADFLDDVASTAAIEELALYDDVGRRYWTTRHPTPPEEVAAVLSSQEPLHRLAGTGTDERLQAIAPLKNEEGCMRCHGTDSQLRGAVSITVSTAVAEKARQASWSRRRLYTGLNLLGILIILAALLQYLVARPVNRIGEIAEQVGNGNLTVTVERADPDGDEISRLGNRINEMVRGLRTKMQLEKFVSKGTAEAAAGAGLHSISRKGERRAVTVLFSDIRGFTQFSERFEPEDVVEMLNRLLQAQAEVVREFGGDIDKYVGDELMAVFTGDRAETSAVECAVRMLDAVTKARRAGETLGVGIGISAGDVVYGAIGHEDRMDYTVIGDVVNTGSRLCSVADQDEILISSAVYDAVQNRAGPANSELNFQSGEPLVLKGKREPVPVYKVESPEARPKSDPARS